MSNDTHRRATPPIQAQMQHESPPLWTVRDVACFARCSLRQVGYLRQEGLPFVRIGRLVRFDPPQVVGWLLCQVPASQPSRRKEVAP